LAKPDSPLAKVVSIFHRSEDLFLCALLTAMIVMAFGQIVLRNVFQETISWGDAFLRHLVLWVGLSGAVVATRKNRHITIDLVSRFISPRGAVAVRVFTDGFAAVVCGAAAYAAARFVASEMESGGKAFGSVPTWVGELIIPVAFGIMAIRFGRFFIVHLIQAIKGAPEKLPENGDAPGASE
jgi:TRAP-type C4-dicarboxylate transport system permease small subunit